MRPSSSLQSAAGALAAMTLTACAAGDGKSIASLRHDLGDGATLFAYPAEPAAQNRQEDQVHRQLYRPSGATKSPRTPYICVWRDPVPPGLNRAVAPDRIFLTCVFGTIDWEPPAKIVDQAAARLQRQEAVIRIQWDRSGATYKMTRLDVEVRDLSTKLNFRSRNSGDQISEVRAKQSGMKFPESQDEPFTFRLDVSAPERANGRDPAGKAIASLSIEGTAAPMPPWVMY